MTLSHCPSSQTISSAAVYRYLLVVLQPAPPKARLSFAGERAQRHLRMRPCLPSQLLRPQVYAQSHTSLADRRVVAARCGEAKYQVARSPWSTKVGRAPPALQSLAGYDKRPMAPAGENRWSTDA